MRRRCPARLEAFQSALRDALLQAGLAVAGPSTSQPLYDISRLFDKDKVGLGFNALKLLFIYLSNVNFSVLVTAGDTNLYADERPAGGRAGIGIVT